MSSGHTGPEPVWPLSCRYADNDAPEVRHNASNQRDRGQVTTLAASSTALVLQ